MAKKVFGSDLVNTVGDSNRTPVVLAGVVDDTNFTETDESIVLGGVSLNLSKSGDTYAITIINETDVDTSSLTAILYGEHYELCLKGTGYNVIRVNDNTPRAGDLKQLTVLAGIPLTGDDNDTLIFAEKEAPTAGTDVEFFLGGSPLLARLIGDKTYMVISLV